MNIGEFKLCEYMGDSVYIGLDEIGRLWIFIYNGFIYNGLEPTNKICLEDDVLGNFIMAVRKFGYKDLIRGPND